MQSLVNIIYFLKLKRSTGNKDLLERWIQFLFNGFKTVNMARVIKTAMIDYTWFFFYEIAHSYEEAMHVAPESGVAANTPVAKGGTQRDHNTLQRRGHGMSSFCFTLDIIPWLWFSHYIARKLHPSHG